MELLQHNVVDAVCPLALSLTPCDHTHSISIPINVVGMFTSDTPLSSIVRAMKDKLLTQLTTITKIIEVMWVGALYTYIVALGGEMRASGISVPTGLYSYICRLPTHPHGRWIVVQRRPAVATATSATQLVLFAVDPPTL